MMAEAKKLAEIYSAEVLDTCINDQISNNTNVCYMIGSDEEIVGTLSKAKVLRNMVEGGMTMQIAMRNLAHRMRSLSED
jgi:ribosomal protein L17